MIKICFVCLGNICRSPMAEFIMKKKIKDLALEDIFYIDSKATSSEEEGNDIYPPIKDVLNNNNIPYTKHHASTLVTADYEKYDYFIGMDTNNITHMKYLFNGDPKNKVYRLLDYANLKKDVEDPWYTRNFEKVYKEIDQGCTTLLNILNKQ